MNWTSKMKNRKEEYESLIKQNKLLIKKLKLENEIKALDNLPKELDNYDFKTGYAVNMFWMVTKALFEYFDFTINGRKASKTTMERAKKLQKKMSIKKFQYFGYKDKLGFARCVAIENPAELKERYAFFRKNASKVNNHRYILRTEFFEEFCKLLDSAKSEDEIIENAKAYFHLTQFSREAALKDMKSKLRQEEK
jgi:hypothetical protein